MHHYGSVKEGSGTYNRGSPEITFYYVEHYEGDGRLINESDIDRKETYQYELEDGILKFKDYSEYITFEKQ